MKKWLSILSRPAFESANPDKRAQAVADETSHELLARLPDLARHDNDPKVRMAALRRIDDLSLLADRARLDANAEVRALARGRLRHFMLDQNTDIEQRQRQLRVLEDNELLEEIARQAEPTDLRRAALERIQRPSLLLERCQKDRDPALRLELLKRIDDPAALQRLTESARKTDKQLARAARDKLASLRLAEGDIDATRARAEAICRELDGWLRVLPDDLDARLQQAEQQWSDLAERLDGGSQQRFAGLLSTLRHMQSVAERPVPTPPTATIATPADIAVDPIEAPAESAAASPDPAENQIAAQLIDAAAFVQFVATTVADQAANPAALDGVRKRLVNEFAAAQDAPESSEPKAALLAWLDREGDRLAAREQQLHDWQSALSDFAAAVEAGQIQRAREARAALQTLGTKLSDRPAPSPARPEHRGGGRARGGYRSNPDDFHATPSEQRRLTDIEQAFDKLTRWQQWSNNSQRQRLCEQIEASIGSGLHPDALLTRIKDAQAEWQRLAEMESELADGQAFRRLDGRFRALCSKVIAPVRPYLQKRSALRAEKQSELAARIDVIEQRLQATAGAADVFPLTRELREAWPLLDTLTGRERGHLGERLRQLKSTLDARIEQDRESTRATKQAFIAKLRRQLAGLDNAAAIAVAKDAGVRWKSLTRADRHSEQKLWEEFRGLIDPVFEQARGEQNQREAKASADRQEIDAVLAGFGDLVADIDSLASLDAESSRLNQRWQALIEPSSIDQRRLEQVQGALERRRADLVRTESATSRARTLALHHRLCAMAATAGGIDAADLAAARAAIEGAAIGTAERTALLMHCAELDFDSGADHGALAEQLNVLAIRAELLAGIDSPPADAIRRRELQLQRLAEKLKGGGASPDDARRDLWLAWLALGGDCPERAMLDHRIAAALAPIPAQP